MKVIDTKGIILTAPGGGTGAKVYDTQGRLLVKQIETGVGGLIAEIASNTAENKSPTLDAPVVTYV